MKTLLVILSVYAIPILGVVLYGHTYANDLFHWWV